MEIGHRHSSMEESYCGEAMLSTGGQTINAKFPLIITICVTIEIKSGSSSLTYRRDPFKDLGHAVDAIVLIVKKF